VTSSFAMPFGKYRGRPITEVDGGYLHWLFEKIDEWHSAPLREAIVEERARRKAPAPSSAEAPQCELPVQRPREQSRRAPEPTSATCAICGLGGSDACPLVHARCASDEVPF